MARLGTAFFARDAETVARELVGATLVALPSGRRARIVETEAYVGPHDLACHARAGVTKRTRVLYGPPGRAYVYLVYGMHHLLNVVTGPDGDGQAVLIRAAEPMGFEADLSGPAKLTQRLGINVEADNDRDLGDRIAIEPSTRPPPRIAVGPRIGVDYAGEWTDAPLRFFDADSRAVSGPRRANDKARRATADAPM